MTIGTFLVFCSLPSTRAAESLAVPNHHILIIDYDDTILCSHDIKQQSTNLSQTVSQTLARKKMAYLDALSQKTQDSLLGIAEKVKKLTHAFEQLNGNAYLVSAASESWVYKTSATYFPEIDLEEYFDNILTPEEPGREGMKEKAFMAIMEMHEPIPTYPISLLVIGDSTQEIDAARNVWRKYGQDGSVIVKTIKLKWAPLCEEVNAQLEVLMSKHLSDILNRHQSGEFEFEFKPDPANEPELVFRNEWIVDSSRKSSVTPLAIDGEPRQDSPSLRAGRKGAGEDSKA